MPRFVGQSSNTGANVILLVVVVAIASVILEYVGVIDIIPGFGTKGRDFRLQSQLLHEQMTEPTIH